MEKGRQEGILKKNNGWRERGRERERGDDGSVRWINSRPFPHHKYHPRLMCRALRWAQTEPPCGGFEEEGGVGAGCRDRSLTWILGREGEGQLNPWSGYHICPGPSGADVLQMPGWTKRGINHFQLDDSPPSSPQPGRVHVCVCEWVRDVNRHMLITWQHSNSLL